MEFTEGGCGHRCLAYIPAFKNAFSAIAAGVYMPTIVAKIRKQLQAAGSVTLLMARPGHYVLPLRGALGVCDHQHFCLAENVSLADHIVHEKSTAFGVKGEETERDYLADDLLKALCNKKPQNGLKRHVLVTVDGSSADELGERIKEYGQSRVHLKPNRSSIRISSSSSMSTGQSDLLHGYMRPEIAPCVYPFTPGTAKISPGQNLSIVVTGPRNLHLSQSYMSEHIPSIIGGPEYSAIDLSINIQPGTIPPHIFINCYSCNNLNQFPDGPSGSDRSNHHQHTLGDESACGGNSGHRGGGGSMICPVNEQRGSDGRDGDNSSGHEPSEGSSDNSNWLLRGLVFLGQHKALVCTVGVGFCGILLVKPTSRVPMDMTSKLQVGVKSTTERRYFLKGASKRR